MKRLLPLFLVCGTTICADTHTDQQQMADDIYHRSFVPDMGEAFVGTALRSPYQTYIRLDGCDFIMEIHTPSDAGAWELDATIIGDVASIDVEPTLNGTPYDYFATPSEENGTWYASSFFLIHADGQSFQQIIYGNTRDENGDREVLIESSWGKTVGYVMPFVDSEQALADLLADILTYRDSYCLGAS